MLHKLFNTLSSIDGNLPLSNVNSFSSDKGSISIKANLSKIALSITLVAVYSIPIFAVAINETPFATLIVGESSFSSKRK